jgi:hypothetical protein
LVSLLIALEYISVPVAEYIVAAIGSNRIGPASDTVRAIHAACIAAGPVEGAPVANEPVRYDPSPVGVYIRPVAVGIHAPVSSKIVAIESIGTVTVPSKGGTIDPGTPPTAAPAITAAKAQAYAEIQPAAAIAIPKAPSAPWIIAHVKSPGPGTGIVIPAKPGIIIETRAVYDRRSIDI